MIARIREMLLGQRRRKSAEIKEAISMIAPNADLSGRDLRGAKLAGRDLRGVNFSRADMSSVDLSRCDLTGANLTGTKLLGAKLLDAEIIGVEADGVCLVDANIRGAKIIDFRANGGLFEGADLRGVTLSKVDLTGSDFTMARLCDIDFADTNLSKVTFEQADLVGARLEAVLAHDADFEGAIGVDRDARELLRDKGAAVGGGSWSRAFSGGRGAQAVALVLVLVLGGYLVAKFVGSGSLSVDEIEGRAQRDAVDGDVEGALVRYEGLLERASLPSDKLLYLFEMSNLVLNAGRFDDAMGYLQEAREFATTPEEEAELLLRDAEIMGIQGSLQSQMEIYEALTARTDIPAEMLARAYIGISDGWRLMGFPDRALALHEELLVRFSQHPTVVLEVNRSMAEMFSSRGDYEEALAVLDRISGFPLDDRQSGDLLVLRGRLYSEQGDKEQALNSYQELRHRFPEYPDTDGAVRLAVASLAFESGDVQSSEEMLEALAEGSVSRAVGASAALLLGRIRAHNGEALAAQAVWRSVIDRYPDNAAAVESARVSLATSLLADSVEASESVIAELLERGDAELASNLLLGQAQTFSNSGDYDEAKALVTRIIEQFPEETHKAAKRQLAGILVEEGAYPEAVRAYRELMETAESIEERVMLEAAVAETLLQGGRQQEATLGFESLRDNNDSSTEAYALGILGLARVAESRGDVVLSRSLYENVADTSLDPGLLALAYEGLAQSWLDEGSDDQAMRAYQRFLSKVPPNHESAISARAEMAGILLRRGELEAATNAYQELYDISPAGERRVDLLFSVAELHEERGLLEQALDGYLEVVSSPFVTDVRVSEAVSGAARSLMAQGKAQEALDMVEANISGVEEGALRVSLLQIKVDALRVLNRSDEADIVGEQLMGQAGDDELAILMASIEQAQGLATAGDYSGAISAYQDLYRQIEDPSTKASMQLAIAQVHSMAGNLDQAREYYEGISREFPDMGEAIFDAQMGISFMERQTGDNAAALVRYNSLSAPDVGSQVWRLEQIAQTLEAMGRDEEALEGYESILVEYPGRVEAVIASKNGVARLRRAMGELELARTLYLEVSALSVESFQRDWARLNAATILLDQGLLDDAFFALREVEAATTDPEVVLQARLGMVGIYQEKERFDLALEIINETSVDGLGPDWASSLAQSKASTELAMESYDAAQATWEELIASHPDNEEANIVAKLGLVEVALRLEDFDLADSIAREVIEESQDSAWIAMATLALGRSKLASGDSDGAERLFDQVVTEFSEHPELVAIAVSAVDGINEDEE